MSRTPGKSFSPLRKTAWRGALFILLPALLLVPALAVSTSHWTQNNQGEFVKGTFHNLVVTSLGDLKLSRAVKTLLEQDPLVDGVHCLAEGPDGTIYAGTSPHGLVLTIKDQTVNTLAKFGDAHIISSLMLDANHNLLVGVSGAEGKIYRIELPAGQAKKAAAGGVSKPATTTSGDAAVRAESEKAAIDVAAKAKEIFASEGVQYIWAMQQTADGKLYAATGPGGQLFEIDAAGKASVILASDEDNLLSLISDGNDLLYVGCDPNGIIYRVNRKTREAFVVYQAGESEVHCLAMDAKGNLYAATAEATEQPGKPEEPLSRENDGRPESATLPPLPSTAPAIPKPPAVPDPNEPNPIPRGKPHDRQTRGLELPDWAAGSVHINAMILDSLAEPTPPAPPAHGQPRIATPTTGPTPPISGPQAEVEQPKASGNAIYKIDPHGFVTEIFRAPVVIYSMVEHGGTLLAGTGGEGLIYQISPDKDETTVLARVDPKQVTCLLNASDGRILLGTANAGTIATMGAGYADGGTFTSVPLDATQISRFGKIHLHGSLPAGTELTVSTRSGNMHDPAKAGWSAWTPAVPATEYTPVTSPAARYLQYRLTFASKDSKATPVVNDVDTSYQMPNLAPVVKVVKAVSGDGAEQKSSPPGASAAGGTRTVSVLWDAEDPNGDSLVYTLYWRNGSSAPWVVLKDKLTENRFDWDTRNVPDGRYEIKVVASDALANPVGEGLTASRVSEPIIVDNTPPVISDAKATATGHDVKVEATLTDQSSALAACAYSMDANEDWQTVLPSDRIFDSPEAKVSFSVSFLAAGPHQITLRATDSKGNQAFKTLLVTIEAK